MNKSRKTLIKYAIKRYHVNDCAMHSIDTSHNKILFRDLNSVIITDIGILLSNSHNLSKQQNQYCINTLINSSKLSYQLLKKINYREIVRFNALDKSMDLKKMKRIFSNSFPVKFGSLKFAVQSIFPIINNELKK